MMDRKQFSTKMLRSLFFALIMIFFVACKKNEDTALPNITPGAQGSFVDSRDGFTYHWVRYNGLEWMVENSHYQSSGSAVYDLPQIVGDGSAEAATLKKYGYLYSYDGAVLAVPPGWRLPTDEDWKKLEMVFGMSQTEADQLEWRGSVAGALMAQVGGGTEFNLLYAGYQTVTVTYGSNYRLMGMYGLYWTGTEDLSKANSAYYRKMLYNSAQVFRYSTNKNDKMSVRFVRDAQ